MNNRIQSGVKLKTSMRLESRAAYRHFYEHKPVSQESMFAGSMALTDSARLQSEHHAFAIAANAIREQEKARLARVGRCRCIRTCGRYAHQDVHLRDVHHSIRFYGGYYAH